MEEKEGGDGGKQVRGEVTLLLHKSGQVEPLMSEMSCEDQQIPFTATCSTAILSLATWVTLHVVAPGQSLPVPVLPTWPVPLWQRVGYSKPCQLVGQGVGEMGHLIAGGYLYGPLLGHTLLVPILFVGVVVV